MRAVGSWLVRIVAADGSDSVWPVRAATRDEAHAAARRMYREETRRDDDRMVLAVEWPL